MPTFTLSYATVQLSRRLQEVRKEAGGKPAVSRETGLRLRHRLYAMFLPLSAFDTSPRGHEV